MLAGLLIGLFIGVAIAVGVTIYLNRSASPFASKVPASQSAAASQTPEAKPEVMRPKRDKDEVAAPEVGSAPAEASTTQFDFYKMLPETETKPARPAPTATPAPKPRPDASAASRASAPVAKGGWLQAGAFQNEADADNLKAKLALIGVESRILTSEVPDKGVWHRVRIGPYSSNEELDKVRAQLKSNGIDSTVIRGK